MKTLIELWRAASGQAETTFEAVLGEFFPLSYVPDRVEPCEPESRDFSAGLSSGLELAAR
ncbi:hypothetical protein [Uliginosibacterium sp. H1]|uniref:hypothetical protein n=1 Tax=Uliginosibacterium sp. H1 TaxID=3114757 RepID=UPI002E18D26D|nr:hypothetical protein [Uliginosibacterium sp. H1]